MILCIIHNVLLQLHLLAFELLYNSIRMNNSIIIVQCLDGFDIIIQ